MVVVDVSDVFVEGYERGGEVAEGWTGTYHPDT